MKTWRKEASLLLVGMMMMSGLVAITAPAVVADTQLTGLGDRFSVDFNDATMYQELTYDIDPADNSYYMLGEANDPDPDWTATANTFNVTLALLNSWYTLGNNVSNVYLNITPTGWDDEIFDVNDNDLVRTNDIPGGPVWNPPASGAAPNYNNGTTHVWGWNFDILKTSGLGYSADNYFNLRLTYRLGTGTAGPPPRPLSAVYTVEFKVYIYLSSAFDDNTTANDSPFGVLPILRETTGGTDDIRFEAGDTFTKTQLTLNNYDPSSAITNVNCTITPPVGGKIKFTNNLNYCTLPNGVPNAGTAELSYRSEIAPQTPPGVYTGQATVRYTRADSGLAITETPFPVNWEVDFSFKDTDPYTPGQPAGDPVTWSPFQCVASSVVILNDTRQVDYEAIYGVPTIEQSTYTDEVIRVNVTIRNNGNTPLYNVQFGVAPGSGFLTVPVTPGAGWDFFRNPRFFWQNVNAAGPVPEYDTISQTFAQINVSATVTLTIEMYVAANIPIGVHRLPLSYDGYFFNDSSLGEASGFFEINGGDGVVNGLNDLTAIFSIEVVDSVIACHIPAAGVAAGNAGDKGALKAETITVTIVNDEMYAFIDATVRANFTGTPWYNPVINMRNPWVDASNANPSMPYATAWAAGGNLVVSFVVDTDPNMTPDRYPFQLQITAVIEATLEVVTVVIDYRQGAVIDYSGYGPEIFITAFTGDDEIVPGQTFNLVLTVQNQGDETLRDVWVEMPRDDTQEYDWDFEEEFKDQFDWNTVFENWGYGGDVELNNDFPSEMFYTMESLDVDNIKEIVEINLYADGVFSDPGAKITLIHILDLAPGASFDVTFDMFADKDMVNGKPYSFNVVVTGRGPDSNDRLSFTRTISVQSSLPGDSYNPVELNWFDAGLKALALFLFFIIVLAILLFVYNMFKGEPYDEDEDFEFEDEEPFEQPEAPATEKKEGELVEP
jgi:cbb3-type cytochrome oxidase subunit 3